MLRIHFNLKQPFNKHTKKKKKKVTEFTKKTIFEKKPFSQPVNYVK